ncbi:MAG: glycosyltransferase [Blastochloris sp.]|nr:glycosyltransferase [Blastochloris sp.]
MSREPWVVYLREFHLRNQSNEIHKHLKSLRRSSATFLVSLSWSHHSESVVLRLVRELREWREKYPHFNWVVLTNTKEEALNFQQQGQASEWVHHNAFVDPTVFSLQSKVKKKWDAVYNAALSPYKRHELAREVKSLGLITYDFGLVNEREYRENIRKDLIRAHWFNYVGKAYRYLSEEEVSRAHLQCRVGLCLSAEEGGMMASIQYLLAGLPVVTTPSMGGRDVFFDPDYVLTVEASPEAVASGVQEMIRRNLDSEWIRQRSLEKMKVHQKRLLNMLRRLSAVEYGEGVDDEQIWVNLLERNRRVWTLGDWSDLNGV